MAAYRRVYDSRHLQVDCQEPGSAPEPYAQQSNMGCRCFFTMSAGLIMFLKNLAADMYLLISCLNTQLAKILILSQLGLRSYKFVCYNCKVVI